MSEKPNQEEKIGEEIEGEGVREEIEGEGVSEKPKEEKKPEEEIEGEGELQGDRGDKDFLRDDKKPLYDYCIHPTEKDLHVPGLKSIIFSVLSQLTSGAELSKVIFPVEFCERRSLLEKMSDFAANIHFAFRYTKLKAPTSLDRMLGIVKMYLSAQFIQPPGAKKPYNPIHGEVLRCHLTDRSDHSISTFITEQVSHHPPISAFFGENRKHKVQLEGYYHPQSRFFGNSVGAIAEGYATIVFEEFKEIYKVNWPDYYFRGLFWGTMKLEICGKVNISCRGSPYSALIEFIPKPTWGGDWYCIKAKITDNKLKQDVFLFDGKWNERIFIRKRMNDGTYSKRQIFHDTAKFDPTPTQFISKKNLKEYESQRVWGKLTEEVVKNSLEGARKEKVEVEEAQREWRRKLAENNEVYVHKYFKKRKDNSWRFIGKDNPDYKVLLNKWLP